MLHEALGEFPLLIGAALGVSLAAPPGPVMAIMAREGARSWRRGFLTGMAAMAADAVFFALVWFGALRLLAHDWLMAALSAAGGLLMLRFARGAWASRNDPLDGGEDATSFLGAFGIAITNPYQIAWWATAGLALLANLGVAAVVGFFGGITAYVALFSAAVRFGAERWEGLPRVVAVVSAAMLVGFAAWSLWRAAAIAAP